MSSVANGPSTSTKKMIDNVQMAVLSSPDQSLTILYVQNLNLSTQ